MYYRLPLCVINEPINFNADHLAKKLVDKKAPKEVIFKVISLTYFSIIAKQVFLILLYRNFLTLKKDYKLYNSFLYRKPIWSH